MAVCVCVWIYWKESSPPKEVTEGGKKTIKIKITGIYDERGNDLFPCDIFFSYFFPKSFLVDALAVDAGAMCNPIRIRHLT